MLRCSMKLNHDVLQAVGHQTRSTHPGDRAGADHLCDQLSSADVSGPATSDRPPKRAKATGWNGTESTVAVRQAHHQRKQHVPDDAGPGRPGTWSSPPHHGLGQCTQREHRAGGTQKCRPADRSGCRHRQRDKGSRKAGAPESADDGRLRVEGGANSEGFTGNAVASGDGRPSEVEDDQRAEAPAGSRHTSMGQRHTLDRTDRARRSQSCRQVG